jgi:hypothetical protein
VLSGTIERLGDTVHMTAQLVHADDDRTVWAQSLVGNQGDLLRMQRVVARSILHKVRGTEDRIPPAPEPSAGSLDPVALDLYVRGRYWWDKRGPGLLTSIDFFTKALDVDPTFALAYSGLADAYVQLGYGSLLRPNDAFPKARAARTGPRLDARRAARDARLREDVLRMGLARGGARVPPCARARPELRHRP